MRFSVKKIKKSFVEIGVSIFCFLLVDIAAIVSCNLTEINVADYISQNVKDCKKNPNTELVDFKFVFKKEIASWFFYNQLAASDLAELTNHDSLYFSISSDFQEWQFENFVFSCDVNKYGIADREIDYLPVGLSITYGDVNLNNYDPENVKNNEELTHCLISESFAKYLIECGFSNEFSDLIGKHLYNASLFKTAIIDGVCSYNTIMSDYQDSIFIVANFKGYEYTNSTITLEYKASDKQYTNFSFFKKMFYNSSWHSPSGDIENGKMIFSVPNNEWIVKECDKIINRSFKLNVFKYLLLLLYATFSFFSDKFIKSFSFVKDKNVLSFVSLFIYFLVFQMAFIITDHLTLFGMHLIGKSLDVIVFEIFYIISIFVIRIFKKIIYEKDDNKIDSSNDNNSYFKLNI